MNRSAILSLCVLFTAIITISSCSKNALDQPGFPGLRCAVGSTEYIADSATYTRSLGTAIYAYTGGAKKMQFFLTRTNTGVAADSIGTYNLDSTSNVAYYIDGGTTYRSISGSLSISQYYNDSLKMITGSFNFVGREPGSSGNTVNIATGYFNNIPRR